MDQFAYLIGVSITFIVWFALWYKYSAVRARMVRSGLLCMMVMVPLFFIHKVLYETVGFSGLYNPGYWSAPSLFDLNNRTGGISIEDVLFMFSLSGMCTGTFHAVVHRMRWPCPSYQSLIPLTVYTLSYLFIGFFLQPHPIYLLIVPALLGGVVHFVEHPACSKSIIASVGVITAIYGVAFFFFTLLFPSFIAQYYNIAALSGIHIVTVPIEELYFAASFALLWCPMKMEFKS